MDLAERMARRIKLRDLRILLAVAKTGSMGKAATELALSQPSVSKAIAEIENTVGLRLLDRSPRGIEPTVYASALLKCGVAVFDELRQGSTALEFLIDPAAGELRIGCTETLAGGFVSAVIDRFSRQYPRVTFQLIPADPMTLVNRELRQRNVELVVAGTSMLNVQPDITIRLLFNDRYVVVVGAESRLIRRRRLRLPELMNEPWVLPPLDSVPGRHITQTLGRNGLQPPQTQMVSFSVPVHYQLLATGRYVTMLPLSLLRFGKHLSLKVLPIDVPQEPYPTGAVTLSKRTLTPIAQNFLRLARTLSEPLIMSEQKVRRARTTS